MNEKTEDAVKELVKIYLQTRLTIKAYESGTCSYGGCANSVTIKLLLEDEEISNCDFDLPECSC